MRWRLWGPTHYIVSWPDTNCAAPLSSCHMPPPYHPHHIQSHHMSSPSYHITHHVISSHGIPSHPTSYPIISPYPIANIIVSPMLTSLLKPHADRKSRLITTNPDPNPNNASWSNPNPNAWCRIFKRRWPQKRIARVVQSPKRDIELTLYDDRYTTVFKIGVGIFLVIVCKFTEFQILHKYTLICSITKLCCEDLQLNIFMSIYTVYR